MAKKLDVSRFRTYYVSRLYNSTRFLVQGTPKDLINALASVMDKGNYQPPIELEFYSGKIKQKKITFKELRQFASFKGGTKLTAKGKKFVKTML
tara:strand:+ start:487 stop:768 length:282 start_codon:yes stop_codon:yes gene_type:complete